MKKKTYLLLLAFMLGVSLIGCSDTENKNEKEPEVQQEMKEEEPQVQQTQQTEPEEEEVIFSEEYVDLKGYLTEYSDEYQEYYYHTLDVIGKLASNNNYLVRATDGNEMEVPEEDIVILNGTTGIVNVDSTVYAEPNIEAEAVNVEFSYSGEDYILETGNVVTIDTDFENEEFYYIKLINHFWSGYVLKENITLIDTQINGIISTEGIMRDGANSGFDYCITGEVEAGEKVIILGDFKSEYYPDSAAIKDYGYTCYPDQYFILTEDGEVGYVVAEDVSMQE